MARTVNVAEAKTHLSRLLDEVWAGQVIVLAKHGTPYAKLVPLTPIVRRPLGFLRVALPDAFFAPLPEDEVRAFQGAYATPPSVLERRRHPTRRRRRDQG